MSNFDDITAEIKAELDKATTKFPQWATDPLHALAILGEEYGELNKAVLQHVYEPEKASIEDIRAEAIQTATMCYRFLASLEKYEFAEQPQHKQEAM